MLAPHACCLACSHGMLAYRHLHDGHAVLWHASAYHYFTPSCSGAEVQRLTEAAAEEVALATSNDCLSAIKHSWCSAMQSVRDVRVHLCYALLQVLTDEKGVYYAVDGVKPDKPLAFRYLELRL